MCIRDSLKTNHAPSRCLFWRKPLSRPNPNNALLRVFLSRFTSSHSHPMRNTRYSTAYYRPCFLRLSQTSACLCSSTTPVFHFSPASVCVSFPSRARCALAERSWLTQSEHGIQGGKRRGDEGATGGVDDVQVGSSMRPDISLEWAIQV